MWVLVHLLHLLTSIDTQFSDWVKANHHAYPTPADAAARKANFAANLARIEASNDAVNASRAVGPIEVPALRVMIVGGSRGIGYQLTKQYAERGHDVHTTYREHVPPSLQQLTAAHASVRLHMLEVTNHTQISQMVADIGALAIDTLIHAAGVNHGNVSEQLAINADAPFDVVTALLPAVLRSVPRRVCIITSDLGTPNQMRRYAPPGSRLHAYALSKKAANDRFRAEEPAWRKLGITAVTMQPGFVQTDMNNGTGKMTAVESARDIIAALKGLTADQAGSFIRHDGRTLSWETGLPTRQRRTSSGAAMASSTGGARKTHPSAGNAPVPVSRRTTADPWVPLEGRSISELFALNPDPLGALSRGEVPAVIIRGALQAEDRRFVMHRLMDPSTTKRLWTWSNSYADMGANLAWHLDKGKAPVKYTKTVAKYDKIYKQYDLERPFQILHRTLRSLGAGRTVATGVDLATNMSFGRGIFRQLMNRHTFPLHLDSLRAHRVGARACEGSGQQANAKRHLQQARRNAAYEDIYRFEQQLAALVLLQRSEMPGAELSAYDLHLDELMGDCTIATSPSGHNVVISHDNASALQARLRFCPLSINEGDLYLINVNRLHVVHPVVGSKSRVVLGSFVGYSSSELKVWS